MTLSRTALTVRLERSEIQMLIDAIQELKWEAANKEEYGDADSYKRRIDELREVLAQPMPAPDK